MFCTKCGKEIADDASFCPNCGTKRGAVTSEKKQESVVKDEGTVITAEDKEYASVEEILKERIHLITDKKKTAAFDQEISSRRRSVAAKKIARSKIKGEEILAILDCSLFDTGHIGWVFTKNALYEKMNLFLPIVIKYSDIDEVRMKGSDCVIKANTGLVLTVGQSFLKMEEYAKLIAQLADFAKKHPDDEAVSVKTSGEFDNTFDQKGSIYYTLAASLVFIWNSYMICHNFSVHNGYVWAIIGIIVNVYIFFKYGVIFAGIFKKTVNDGWWGWTGLIYYIILFLIFGIGIGKVPYEDYLAKAAAPLVTEILEDNYGYYMDIPECVKVDNVYKITDNIYKATAYLENGGELNIAISDAKKGSIYVEITY